MTAIIGLTIGATTLGLVILSYLISPLLDRLTEKPVQSTDSHPMLAA